MFLEDLGAFKTTRSAIEEALRVHLANPVSDQLEIETYTWDVLPGAARGKGDLVDGLEREYAHVGGLLERAGWRVRGA